MTETHVPIIVPETIAKDYADLKWEHDLLADKIENASAILNKITCRCKMDHECLRCEALHELGEE